MNYKLICVYKKTQKNPHLLQTRESLTTRKEISDRTSGDTIYCLRECLRQDQITIQADACGYYNIGYGSATYLKLNARDVSIIHTINFRYLNVLKYCTKHDNIIAVLCVVFQNDRTNEKYIIRRRAFARLKFVLSSARLFYIETDPSFMSYLQLFHPLSHIFHPFWGQGAGFCVIFHYYLLIVLPEDVYNVAKFSIYSYENK